MKKGRMWMLALALASGSPLSAEEGAVMEILNPSEGVVRTEPTPGEGSNKSGMELQSGEISQIRSDELEEHFRNHKLK